MGGFVACIGTVGDGYVGDMTIPYVGRCLGSGEPPRESSIELVGDDLTGACMACSGRFELRGGKVVEHETAQDDEREPLHEQELQSEIPPSRTEGERGPSPEEEMRGAQPPNDDPDGARVEHEPRPSGNTAEVVDLDHVNETGSARSAHRPKNG